VWMGKGDRLIIETPGGGAWGAIEEDGKDGANSFKTEEEKISWAARGSLAERAAAQASF
jgi:5-oxoprolinase (ATP-hydrolysing)